MNLTGGPIVRILRKPSPDPLSAYHFIVLITVLIASNLRPESMPGATLIQVHARASDVFSDSLRVITDASQVESIRQRIHAMQNDVGPSILRSYLLSEDEPEVLIGMFNDTNWERVNALMMELNAWVPDMDQEREAALVHAIVRIVERGNPATESHWHWWAGWVFTKQLSDYQALFEGLLGANNPLVRFTAASFLANEGESPVVLEYLINQEDPDAWAAVQRVSMLHKFWLQTKDSELKAQAQEAAALTIQSLSSQSAGISFQTLGEILKWVQDGMIAFDPVEHWILSKSDRAILSSSNLFFPLADILFEYGSAPRIEGLALKAIRQEVSMAAALVYLARTGKPEYRTMILEYATRKGRSGDFLDFGYDGVRAGIEYFNHSRDDDFLEQLLLRIEQQLVADDFGRLRDMTKMVIEGLIEAAAEDQIARLDFLLSSDEFLHALQIRYNLHRAGVDGMLQDLNDMRILKRPMDLAQRQELMRITNDSRSPSGTYRDLSFIETVLDYSGQRVSIFSDVLDEGFEVVVRDYNVIDQIKGATGEALGEMLFHVVSGSEPYSDNLITVVAGKRAYELRTDYAFDFDFIDVMINKILEDLGGDDRLVPVSFGNWHESTEYLCGPPAQVRRFARKWGAFR